jgi:hypothetical protein
MVLSCNSLYDIGWIGLFCIGISIKDGLWFGLIGLFEWRLDGWFGVMYEKLIVGLVEDLMHGRFGVETTYYFCFKIIIVFNCKDYIFLYVLVVISSTMHCVIDSNVFNTCVDLVDSWSSKGGWRKVPLDMSSNPTITVDSWWWSWSTCIFVPFL